MAVRHLEAVCIECLEKAGDLEQQVRIEAKVARDCILKMRFRGEVSDNNHKRAKTRVVVASTAATGSTERAEDKLPTGRTILLRKDSAARRVASQAGAIDSKKRHSISIFLNDQPDATVTQTKERVYGTNERKLETGGKNSLL